MTNISSYSQVCSLNQEVSSLAKRIHDIMHFLPPQMSMRNYGPPVSSHSYGIPAAPGPSVTASTNRQSQTPVHVSPRLHLHHEAISHPARNVWGCSGLSSQRISPILMHSSSPVSSCLHLCCSNREGPTFHTLQSPCRTFQLSRTTPNSPCMTHQHAQGGLLAINSAFGSIPVIGQNTKVVYNTSIPTSTAHTLYSPFNSSLSHPPSVQINPEHTHNQSRSQIPIHSSIILPGASQYQTTLSSLAHSGGHSSMCSGHNHSQQGPIIGPRKKGPVGSSPIHRTQDFACSQLDEVIDRSIGSSMCKERTSQEITAEQHPFLDVEEKLAS